jgi:hypothetical protein
MACWSVPSAAEGIIPAEHLFRAVFCTRRPRGDQHMQLLLAPVAAHAYAMLVMAATSNHNVLGVYACSAGVQLHMLCS